MAHDVFISYAAEDKPTADAVCAALERDRVRCWIAPRDVLPGVPYAEGVIAGIRGARVFVLVFSSNSNASPHVMREVERAVSLGLPVIPLRIEDVLPSKSMEYYLSAPHWLDALTPPLEAHLDRLVRTIGVLLAEGTESVEPRISAPQPPQAPAPSDPTFAGIIRDPGSFAGRRVGPYAVQEHLGSGGSGLVYRALNVNIGQAACLKIFYPFKAEFSGIMTTISRGVRGLAALNHPNIVRIYDFGPLKLADASSFYVAMEYVPGQPLGKWAWEIDRAKAPDRLRRVFGAARDLTSALETAHACAYIDEVGFEQRGVLHGDIKPANILVRPDGSPVLLDFMMVDVMRLLDPRVVPSHLLEEPGTALTAAFGTPGFMAPEQERQGLVTARTDVYSLGVTFIHLFFPNAEEAPQNWAMDHPEDGLDPVRALIRDMTAYSPEKRPAGPAAVAQRLAAAAASLGIAFPAAPGSTAAPVSRRGLRAGLSSLFSGRKTGRGRG